MKLCVWVMLINIRWVCALTLCNRFRRLNINFQNSWSSIVFDRQIKVRLPVPFLSTCVFPSRLKPLLQSEALKALNKKLNAPMHEWSWRLRRKVITGTREREQIQRFGINWSRGSLKTIKEGMREEGEEGKGEKSEHFHPFWRTRTVQRPLFRSNWVAIPSR